MADVAIAHLSLMSVAQNEHMKRITAWAAMIAVPLFVGFRLSGWL